MAIEFKLPEVSEGVESADVAEVRVKEGDTIEAGQAVMEIETEKAVADLPCPHAGKVTKIHVSPGDTVRVGQPLLTIEEEAGAPAEEAEEPGAPREEAKPERDEPPADKKPEAKPAAREERAAPERREAAVVEEAPPRRPARPAPERTRPTPAAARLAEQEENGREVPPPPAGPSTRRLARELGVDLRQVRGSGPGGRITTEDVQAFVRDVVQGHPAAAAPAEAPELPDFSKFGPVERKSLSRLAKTSAGNVSLAWRTIPHVTQHDLADVTDLEEARRRYLSTIGKGGPKITMTAVMVKAVIGALRAFPQFNASLDARANEIVLKRYYNIGVAVDTEYGLVVPVIREVDRKSVVEIAAELSDVAEKARSRKLGLDDMQGGTFTITNLGGIGGTAFTPIVNHPEAAILGMSRTQSQLQLLDGELVERVMLPLSLSYDHRVVNGADAARFVVKLSHILSDFFQLLVEC